MSNIDITIPLPVLTAGQYFKVRYRDDPAHAWVDIAHQTNAPFTITGLSAGMYELSFTLVRSDDPLVACEEVIQWFEVVEEGPCGEFSFVIVANDDATLYTLQLTPGSMPVTPPCGGYDVVYGIAGGTMSTVHYANIVGTILLPAGNHIYHVEVHALDCEGNYTTCYNDDVHPPEGGCDHATLVIAKLLQGSIVQYPPYGWYIELTIVQSAPPTNPFTVAYSQGNSFNNNNNVGGINDSGIKQLTATAATIYLSFAVNPTQGYDLSYVGGRWVPMIIYNGTIADRCGWSTKWSASVVVS